MIQKAVILAAGEGRRLKPFTETMPKVMLPVANKPILEYVLEALKGSGVRDIIIVVGYKKEVIQEYFRDRVDIVYVNQDKQLGTAHALQQAYEYLDESFIVLPGDNIIDSDSIKKLLEEKNEYALLVKESPQPSKYGVVSIKKSVVSNIVEKPEEEVSNFISTGIHKFPIEVFRDIDKLTSEGIYDLTTVVQKLLERNVEISAITANLWEDVVYPWNLIDVNTAMLREKTYSNKKGVIERNVVLKGSISIGEDTVIHPNSYIVGPVAIGENCEIGPNACILPSTTIGDNVTIHPFTEIRESVIMDEVEVESHSFISNSVLGRGCRVGTGFSTNTGRANIRIEGEFVEVEKIGSMIGEYTDIGSHVTTLSGVIIGRKCRVNPGSRITHNLPTGSIVM